MCATALRVVWRLPMNRVRAGLRGGPGWSAAEYKTVVKCLAAAPQGSCSADDLHSKLGTGVEAAEAAVQAMIKANMLACRPASGRRHALDSWCLSAHWVTQEN